MRIAIVGAGGVGGYFGGLLARSGQEVTFLARGAHLQALRERGLTIQSLHGDFHLRVRATSDARDVGAADLVLFTVKSYDTESAAESARPLVGEDTVVLSLQNGVDNEEKLERVFGVGRVLGGVTHVESTIAAPGLIQQTSQVRRITFGELRRGISPRAERIQRLFQAAGLDSVLAEDIQVPLWNKFLFICAMAGTTTLTGAPIGPVLAFEETRELFTTVLREADAVGRARGVGLATDVVERSLAFADGLLPTMKSSMQRDRERGNRLEVEALNGTVVRLGRELAVPTPANQAISAALGLWMRARGS
jgi:2-dehydropantoate 2-reductase